MIRKYSVAAVELLTGEAPTPEVECDGYLIMGFQRGEDGKMETVKVAMHGISNKNLIDGMLSDKELYRCAMVLAEVERMYNRPWRRLLRWLRGEKDEPQE